MNAIAMCPGFCYSGTCLGTMLGDLHIEAIGTLYRIAFMDGVWDLSYWLAYRADLPNQVAVSTCTQVPL